MFNRNPQPQKKSGGALFSRQKRTNNSPDMGGDLVLEGEVLRYIMEQARSNGEVTIELSAWRRQTNNGGVMLSLKGSVPYAVRQGGGQQQGFDRQAQQGGYGQQRTEPPAQQRFNQQRPQMSDEEFKQGDARNLREELPWD